MAQNKQVTITELANVALNIMARASIPADDDTLAYVAATRHMLRQIIAGELVVAPPVPDPPSS